MPNSPELAALIAEYQNIDAATKPGRAKEILLQAAALVNRTAEPRKWAAWRGLFGDLAALDDPMAAISAFRDALGVWQREQDPVPWAHCHMQLGTLLAANYPRGSAEDEAAIGHLEAAVGDHPFVAELLGTLYGFRPRGDPLENWRRRITYLEQARRELDPATQINQWIRLSNTLASAYAEEPGANYALAIEQQIKLQTEVVEALDENNTHFVDSCLNLATAYLDRVEGGLEENAKHADDLLQRVWPGARASGNAAQQARILLLLARILIFKTPGGRAQNLREALKLCAEARGLIADRPATELRASAEKQAANAGLALLQLGEHGALEEFVGCCARARELFSAEIFPDEQRKLWQIEADGWIAVREFEQARRCCRRALESAEALIDQATTTAGRLERIWAMRDSAALLAWCGVQAGDLRGALTALERGKALLWERREEDFSPDGIGALIPPNGALILPIWAAPGSSVIIVSKAATGTVLTALPLPRFDKSRLRELLNGPNPAELGGWLLAYICRNSKPEDFRTEIERIGQILYAEFWSDLVARFAGLGIAPGAELVLLPQAGSGVLPFHAAWQIEGEERRWLIERHAIRYAPSLKLLGREAPAQTNRSLSLIVNPTLDLAFSTLEAEWICDARPDACGLTGEKVTKGAVLREIASHPQVHFATHATFDLEDPFMSSIHLAGGDRLTLAELGPALQAHAPSFIALSACETAVARVTSLQDEFLGFPAALLGHGVRQVLATQWSVEDCSTALLMGQFYRELAGEISGAEALRRAQNWLRGLTNREFSSLLRPLRDRPGAVGALASRRRTALRASPPEERPFAHAFFWAGFTFSGA